MATPTSRRMRRGRESTTAADEVLSGYELYNAHGDSKSALSVFLSPESSTSLSSSSSSSIGGQQQQPPSFASMYNQLILHHLSADSKPSSSSQLLEQQQEQTEVSDHMNPIVEKETLFHKLNEAERMFESTRGDDDVVARKRKRNELILAYNRALVLLAAGENDQCIAICTHRISDMIKNKQKPSEETIEVASKMAFLLLDSLLALSVGHNLGLRQHDQFNSPPAEDILSWIETLDSEKTPQLKFLLSLYRSRVDLAQLDSAGKLVEANVRSARKELKTAMEIFQHKLRPSSGAETGSVVSSANSEDNMAQHQEHQQQQQQQPSSVVLQRHNQSALSLKANLEQLKGNTKKSLILCAEALGAAKEDGSYDAVHANNLAVVYGTSQKRHLAILYLIKSLKTSATSQTLFHTDGTARPDQTLSILHNAAICALQARNFASAYECMATCVARSKIFRDRPRCWLHMAEACTGLFTELKRNTSSKLATVEVGDEPLGLIIDSSMLSDQVDITREPLAPIIGDEDDLRQVLRSPLLRARACLEHALSQEPYLQPDALASARLTLAYVNLAFRDFHRALEIAQLVLATLAKTSEDGTLGVVRLLRKRQAATARMYAAEATCALGNMVESMKFLVGDGKDDAFDRLASDLCGVTLETAASNTKGKRRLAKSQTMVRSSACSVTAAMGNPQAAKQLANSANAMEDAFTTSRERSSARRALIYALLRDGHHAPALNLLLSLR